ncbi:MAG TPA: dienelactone hydrolase family protein [Beijerinckiaceae bacterium]|jgi:carboxymethylenebutenolidase|nr:dienelactone hydrolase family protein [Beijerinckiaceae bacterium]
MDDAHKLSLTAPTPLDVHRRGFVFMTSCVAGFTLATGPLNAQTITTPADGLTAGEVKVPSGGVEIPAYRAFPASGGPFPTVLVIQEIFGVHEHIKDVCRRLAKAGYYAIAPELYARQGNPATYTEVPKLIAEIVSKVPDAQVKGDLDACVAFAKASGSANTDRLAVIGFCWGGRQTWLYAKNNPSVKAAAAFYGPLTNPKNDLQPQQVLDFAGDLKVPVIGAYGGKDPGIPLEQVETVQEELKKAGSKSVIYVYPDAPHGFHADYRPSYRKADAELAFKRALDFFKANGA